MTGRRYTLSSINSFGLPLTIDAFPRQLYYLTFIVLVRTSSGLVDEGEGATEVGRERVFGGEEVLADLDLNGTAVTGGADEFPDGPARVVLDELRDGQSGTATGGYRIVHSPASSSLSSYRPLRPGRTAR